MKYRWCFIISETFTTFYELHP